MSQEWVLVIILSCGLIGVVILMLTQMRQLRSQHDQELLRFESMLNEARRESIEREQRLYDLQQQLSNEKGLRATFEEKANRSEQLSRENQELRQQVSHLQNLTTELKTNLDNERQQAIEKLRVVETAQIRLTETFKSLSADALSANNQSFLQLARAALDKYQTTAKQDLSQRQQSIVEMMNPVQQALLKVDGKINDLEKERVGAYEVLKQQVNELIHSQKELRLETSNLVKALRAPTVRGQWGGNTA